MLFMIRSGKTYPDSLLKYFGSLDEYRHELYVDLRRMKKPALFPSVYNNHKDLGRSALLESASYERPDSIIFLERLPAEYRGKKGYVYFYKVKAKKDDLTWKIGMAGMVPEDPNKFSFSDEEPLYRFRPDPYYSNYTYEMSSFTGFTDTRFREEEDMMTQLRKLLKKALYARRKSAQEFYTDEDPTEEVHED